MGVVVRPFSSGDRALLQAGIDSVCGEGRWMRTVRFQPTAAWIHALAAPGCPCHLLLVAEDRGRAVGWCRLLPAECTELEGVPNVELGIGLVREYRGRGLGTALLHDALGWATAAGVGFVSLTVREDNQRARRLFERSGFRSTGAGADRWVEMKYRPGPPGGR